MKRHIAYLKYIIRHKWYVFLACRKLGVSLRQAIMHDMSKFLPGEWFPYARTFYEKDGSGRYVETKEFRHAWNRHLKLNPHHWQYWILNFDNGKTAILQMPIKYIHEMIADWMGAGKAINGNWSPTEWYLERKDKINIHENTRAIVEGILYILPNIIDNIENKKKENK